MYWESYGEGEVAKTEFGQYRIGPTRSGWWLDFHCLCCHQFTKVVPMTSKLETCKSRAEEHHKLLQKRYEDARDKASSRD